jgi:aminoglycoside phosphotransferase (APT) family kinase protein
MQGEPFAVDRDLTRLGTGRTADVRALGEDRVLRRYRIDRDVAPEVAVMEHVARHGYPVPRVFRAEGRDLVMERVHGPSMLAALRTGEVAFDAAGRMLGDLLNRLHAVPPLADAAPGDRVVHLDLHPDNVLLGPTGPVVIDWDNARNGSPALDVAMSAVIIAQATVDRQVPRADALPGLLVALLDAADADPQPALDAAIERRANDPGQTDRELALLDATRALVRRRGRPE